MEVQCVNGNGWNGNGWMDRHGESALIRRTTKCSMGIEKNSVRKDKQTRDWLDLNKGQYSSRNSPSLFEPFKIKNTTFPASDRADLQVNDSLGYNNVRGAS